MAYPCDRRRRRRIAVCTLTTLAVLLAGLAFHQYSPHPRRLLTPAELAAASAAITRGAASGRSGSRSLGLAVAILSRGGADGVVRRAVHRASTIELLRAAGARAGARVTYAFFVQHDAGDNATLQEAHNTTLGGDVRLVMGRETRDLFARTHAAARWATAAGAQLFMKVDDDTWFRPDLVFAEAAAGRIPATRLYWGHEVGTGKSATWPGCGDNTGWVHAACPRYMAGMGYVLSGDVAAIVASVDVDAFWAIHERRLEDVILGLFLAGLQLARVDDARFHDIQGGLQALVAPLTAASIVAHHADAAMLRSAHAQYGVPALAALHRGAV